MSTFTVPIAIIKDIKKHPAADKLEICTFYNLGWEVVAEIGLYNKDEMVVYCPIDAVMPLELSDAMDITKYLSKQRVRTARLRQVYSQGVIIPLSFLPDPNALYAVGEDVKELLNITKYEPPPPPANFAGTQLRRDDRFNRYTDVENLKNFPTVLQEGEQVSISEKIHGCLQSEAKILLANGSILKIKNIVDNKLQIEVIGKDNNGNIVPSKITNWFKNGSTNEWYNVKFERKGIGKGNSFGTLPVTSNHQFYIPDKNIYLPCSELKPGMKVLCSRYTFHLTYLQQQILTGKMLGDGSMSADSIAFGHKEQHDDYITYTLSMLGYLAGNRQSDIISGFGTSMKRARTISHQTIGDIFNSWFTSNKKEVPADIHLTPISLAFWYMDDGSLNHHEDQEDRVNFSTCDFNENSVDNLIVALQKLDIYATKYSSDNRYWRIRLNSQEAHKLFLMIYPYIPSCMKYKLPSYFRVTPTVLLKDIDNEFETYTKEQTILSIEKTKYTDKRIRYDIETETGNFFANYVLVHNSNFRCGWVDEDTFLAGSHNCNLKEDPNNIYWKAVHKYDLREKMRNHISTLIYGEVFGPGIQKKFAYGKKEIEIAIFDVSVNGVYLSCKEAQEVYTGILGLPGAPILYHGEWKPELVKLADGQSTISDTCIKEGIVIKPIVERYNSILGRVILKHISEKYLLKDYGDMH